MRVRDQPLLAASVVLLRPVGVAIGAVAGAPIQIREGPDGRPVP